jgi:hypothetical protein
MWDYKSTLPLGIFRSEQAHCCNQSLDKTGIIHLVAQGVLVHPSRGYVDHEVDRSNGIQNFCSCAWGVLEAEGNACGKLEKSILLLVLQNDDIFCIFRL